MIGVEGHNPSGHCLVASRVIDSFPLSNSVHPQDQDAPSAKRIAMDQAPQMKPLPRTGKTISMVTTTTFYFLFIAIISMVAIVVICKCEFQFITQLFIINHIFSGKIVSPFRVIF